MDYGANTVWEVGNTYNTSVGTIEASVIVTSTASRMWPKYEGNAKVASLTFYDTTSRWLVLNKRIKDNVTGQTYSFSYAYDEPAVNDPTHSDIIKDVLKDDWKCCRDTDRAFSKEFGEYRGVALMREKDQYGKVTLNWYRQDDIYKGQLVRQQVGQDLFSDFFTAIDANFWTASSGVTAVRVNGDNAARLSNANANWNISLQRPSAMPQAALQDGKVMLVQFKLTGASPQAVLALESNDNRRWGIFVKSDNSVVVQWRNTNGGVYNEVALLGAGGFQRDKWYVLMLGTDAPDLLRLWERDKAPESATVLRHQADLMGSGLDWRFKAYPYAGDLYLDTYHELKLLSENETQLAASAVTTSPTWNYPYVGLSIQWVRPTAQQSLIFNNDAIFTGTRSELNYDSYGNVTQIIDKEWNGSDFTAYRHTLRGFYPTVNSSRYLVGLPGYENRYPCPGGTCNTATLLSSQWFVYDNNTLWDQAPADGKLKKMRTLVCRGNSSNQCVTSGDDRYLFSDVLLDYSPEGNLTQRTTYTSYGYYISPSSYAYATTGAQITNYAYADNGYNTYQTSETNALNHQTSWAYDYRLSVPTRITDTNQIVTTAEYDEYARLTKVIRPGDTSASPTVLLTYRAPGSSNTQPFVVEAAQKHSGGALTVRKAYNGLGWLLQQQTAGAAYQSATNDILVDYQYNAYGQVLKQSVPYVVAVWGGSGSAYRSSQQFGTVTSTSYDVFGRVTQVQSPTTAEKSTYSYPSDLATQVCDGRNNCTTTYNDLWGRVVEVHPPLDPWLRYSYDATDRLLKVEKMTSGGTAWATVQMNYDTGGRKTSMSDPDLGNWSYTYDALSNLKTQTDARGCITTLLYDNVNRVTQKSYSTTVGGNCGIGGTTLTYSYDDVTNGNKGKGKRTGMSDGIGITSWLYGDNRGRLTKETRSLSALGLPNTPYTYGPYITQWAYDSGDQMTSMTYPSGEVVNYTYRPQMLVNTVISTSPFTGTKTYVQQTLYDEVGRVTLRTLGVNQFVRWFNYNPWTTQGGRLKEIRSGTPGTYATTNPSVQYLQYDYDAVGNINWIKDFKAGTQQQSFTYDALDRLTSAAATGGDGNGAYSQNYTYDAYGRLATGPLGTYTYGDANHKHAVTAAGSNPYTYDANGNMSSRVGIFDTGPIVYPLYYDAENHLRIPEVGDTSFVYDGDGKRAFAAWPGGYSYYLGNYYEVVIGAGGIPGQYSDIYAGSARVSGPGGWVFDDHLGSTNYELGYFSTSTRYTAWGETRYEYGGFFEFGFTGQRAVRGEIGLYDYGARWYDPALGRFIQPDTIVPNSMDAQAFDRYAYVNNNPLKYTDPSGHILDIVADVASIGYDAYDIYNNGLNWENGIALTLDVGSMFVPFVTGAGQCVKHCDELVQYGDDAAQYISNKADEALNWATGADEAADAGSDLAKQADGLPSNPCAINSFSADTPVMTPAGLKPISELVEGELVLAYNEATGAIGVYPITDTIAHVDPQIVLLTIDSETLETTAEHPFYELEAAPWLVAGERQGRWTDALDLQVGDQIWQADGSTGTVQAVTVVPMSQPMYNLTVDVAHTFFVGQQQWLVHNQLPCIARINVNDLPTVERDALMETINQIDGNLPAPTSGPKAKNWGIEFKNKGGDLPAQAPGYYKEYTVLPSGSGPNRGPLRVVTGKNGERYYTWTHYGDSGKPAFVQIK